MVHANDIIEQLLGQYETILGQDYQRYKNHVYRVYLFCLLQDSSKENDDKYAIAAALHDLGIWTNSTFDYLDPSVLLAKSYLTSIGKENWIEEITSMIYWHHKMSHYAGNHAATIEVFRKADWIDLLLGIKTFGVYASDIQNIRKTLPNLGFHWFLIKMTLKNTLKHPFNPLPMFKR